MKTNSKQITVSAAAHERVVELGNLLHCTRSHAASILIEVADVEAAADLYTRGVAERLAARSAGQPAEGERDKPSDASTTPTDGTGAEGSAPPAKPVKTKRTAGSARKTRGRRRAGTTDAS